LYFKDSRELQKLLKHIREKLRKVHKPLLIFKSKEDHVIPLENVDYTLRNVSSKEKEVIYLENSYHVETMDYDKDLICEKTVDFIKKNS